MATDFGLEPEKPSLSYSEYVRSVYGMVPTFWEQFVKRREQVAQKQTGKCMACFQIAHMTAHHHVPLSIRNNDETIPLCWPCHEIAHELPNAHLAKMSIEEQLEYIRSHLPCLC